MEALKRGDRRMLDRAVSLVAGGAKIDLRLRNVLKEYGRRPDHQIAERELIALRKFVDKADDAAPAASSNGRGSEDLALIAKAISFRESKPPGDARLRAFIDGYRNSARPGNYRVGQQTRGMLRKYIEMCERPASAAPERKAFSGPHALGLGLTGELEMVTGEIALSLLEVNERLGFANRSISKLRVSQYAEDMKAGRWRNTAEPLLIGKDGQLLNGQHRLHAVIDAEVEVPMLIVRGVDLGAFYSIDQARPRKPYDMVSIVGVRNASVVASTLRMIWIWEKYGPAGFGAINTKGASRSFTNEIAAEMAKSRDLSAAVKISIRLRKLAPPTATAFSYWLISQKNHALADEFFEKLATGENLAKGDPILALRQRLISERSDPSSSLKTLAAARMIVRIWNAVRKGQKLVKMPPIADSQIDRPL